MASTALREIFQSSIIILVMYVYNHGLKRYGLVKGFMNIHGEVKGALISLTAEGTDEEVF